MSPFRNDIPLVGKLANRWLNRKALTAVVHRLARWAKVPDVAITWHVEHGPWFDNGVMTIELAGRSATVSIDQAHVHGGRQQLDHLMDVELAPGTPSPESSADSATATV